MKKSEKIDVSYSHGWLRGRMATTDETSGEAQTVAGVDFRVRVSDVRAYLAGEPGVVVLMVEGLEDGVELIGSMKTLDGIMERTSLKEVSTRAS